MASTRLQTSVEPQILKARQGYIQIYTGDGKGKTTAALGLTVRALGAGWKVCWIQFLKGRATSEWTILKTLPGITFRPFGTKTFIKTKPTRPDRVRAWAALSAFRRAIRSDQYHMVIADEILVGLSLKLFSEKDLKTCLQQRSPHPEIVLTGRGATASLVRLADLVTECKARKHYYAKKVWARRGIEF
jgi:cob(I)alamin adenosyltransferase